MKFTVRFRGREITHPEKGREVLDDVIKALEGMIIIESNPALEGKAMTMLIAPRPGAMAASMLNEIVPRSFVSIEAAPAVSLTSVADLTFTA